MSLTQTASIPLPPHVPGGGFDHGDVDPATGRVFVAHTAGGTVEIIDGARTSHDGTIPGCPEASGVLCAPRERRVFAAARGAGTVLVIDADSRGVAGEIVVGPKPNGLAWDGRRGRLLVADVQDFRARLPICARPRWCARRRCRDDLGGASTTPPATGFL